MGFGCPECRASVTRLVLDLRGTTFLDSTGLHLILEECAAAQPDRVKSMAATWDADGDPDPQRDGDRSGGADGRHDPGDALGRRPAAAQRKAHAAGLALAKGG